MKAIYGDVRLNHVARAAFAGYGENGDILFLTVPIFIHRIKGDPQMIYEVKPLLEESQRSIVNALKKWRDSA